MVRPRSRIRVRLLMPEAGMAGAADRWSFSLFGDVRLALRWVAELLRAADAPDARVDLAYTDNPDAARQRAELPPEFRRLAPDPRGRPRRHATRPQRGAVG